MSPPNDPPRQRIMTSPPGLPPSLEERVWRLEHGHGSLERDQDESESKLDKIQQKLASIETQITVWTTERLAEKKSSDLWKNWALGILSALVVASFIWFATFMHNVQVAKAAAGS